MLLTTLQLGLHQNLLPLLVTSNILSVNSNCVKVYQVTSEFSCSYFSKGTGQCLRQSPLLSLVHLCLYEEGLQKARVERQQFHSPIKENNISGFNTMKTCYIVTVSLIINTLSLFQLVYIDIANMCCNQYNSTKIR